MSQQRSRRPARSRQRPPRAAKARATRVAEPETPVTPAAMAPEPHGDLSGALAVGVAAGALAVVAFMTILIAMAAM